LQETPNDFGLIGHFGPNTPAVLWPIENKFLNLKKNIQNYYHPEDKISPKFQIKEKSR